MQSFVIRPMTWPVLRLFSRNPLVRTSDRIETLAVTLAVVLVVIATACAGVVGTIVHENQAQKYLQQAQTRHAVVATAADDTESAGSAVSAGTTAYTVQARWRFNGIDHADIIGWDSKIKTGAPLHIWVDDNGARVERPSPVQRAIADALSIAVVGWLIVILAIAQVAIVVRAHVSRMRDAQWERDLRCLVGEDGGRTNHSQ